MGNAIVSMTIMPESPETNMEAVKDGAIEVLKANGSIGDVASKLIPIAFGIQHLQISVMFDNDKQVEYEEVADQITAKVDGVTDSKVNSVDLAMG